MDRNVDLFRLETVFECTEKPRLLRQSRENGFEAIVREDIAWEAPSNFFGSAAHHSLK